MRKLAVLFLLAAPLMSCTMGDLFAPETKSGSGSGVVDVSGLGPLAWEAGHPERKVWSTKLREEFAAHLADLGVPADIESYCPAYPDLADRERVEVWSTLAVAIARRESAYNPATVFMEPPPLNVASVGLFQLSYEDGFGWCNLDLASESLKDPVTNIDCAVGAMASYVKRDAVVASGSKHSDARGLSRYWSVIRDGSGHFKSEIMAATQGLAFCQP